MNLESYRGRILDADAHLQLPLRVYPEMLGPAGETIHKGFAKMLGGSTGSGGRHADWHRGTVRDDGRGAR